MKRTYKVILLVCLVILTSLAKSYAQEVANPSLGSATAGATIVQGRMYVKDYFYMAKRGDLAAFTSTKYRGGILVSVDDSTDLPRTIPYYWDGVEWKRVQIGAGGSGTSNVNIGAGFRLLNPSTQEIWTLSEGYGIKHDSTTVVNTIATKLDTATVDIRYLRNSVRCGLSCLDCGKVIWSGTGLIFNVAESWHNHDYVPYHTPAGTITLDAAHVSFGRFDAIGLTSAGIAKITGTASADPQLPQFDPCEFVLLTYVFVGAGATTPTQVSDEVIYNENTETWSHTTSGTISTNFASTTFFYQGTKSLSIASWSNNANVIFTAPSVLTRTNYTTLSFFLRLGSTMASNQNISIQFFNGTTAVSNQVAGAINKTSTGSFQAVVFNMASFLWTSTTFTNIRVVFSGSNSNAMQIDWFRLQSGVVQNPPIISFPTWQEVLDAETGEAHLNKDDTINVQAHELLFTGSGTQTIRVKNSGTTIGILMDQSSLFGTRSDGLYPIAGEQTSSIDNSVAVYAEALGTNTTFTAWVAGFRARVPHGTGFRAEANEDGIPFFGYMQDGTGIIQTGMLLHKTNPKPNTGSSIQWSQYYNYLNRSDTVARITGVLTDSSTNIRSGSVWIDVMKDSVLTRAMEIYTNGVVRVNKNLDTLSTKAYARSLAGGGGSNTDSLFGVQDNIATQNRDFNLNGGNRHWQITTTAADNYFGVFDGSSGVYEQVEYNFTNTVNGRYAFGQFSPGYQQSYYSGAFGSVNFELTATSTPYAELTSSGLASGQLSRLRLYPDSMAFFPGGLGKIFIDSLRTGTASDEVMTWNQGMVRRVPISTLVTDTHMGNTNLTQTGSRNYAGGAFSYSLNNLGHWSFNMANGKEFYINNAELFWVALTSNNWALNGNGGIADANYIQAEEVPGLLPKSIYLYSGNSSTNASQLLLRPDSVLWEIGGNGKLNFDSLRTGTSADEIITWNAGMVRKVNKSTIFPTPTWDATLAVDGHSPTITNGLDINMNSHYWNLTGATSYTIATTTNDWGINGKNGFPDGVWIQGDDAPNTLRMYSGISSTRNSLIRMHPDSIGIYPGGNGRVFIDSLRTGTSADEIITWNAGMVRKVSASTLVTATPNIDQVLAAGSTTTAPRGLILGSNQFGINGTSSWGLALFSGVQTTIYGNQEANKIQMGALGGNVTITSANDVIVSTLAGSGTRMVTATSTGVLGTTTIPTGFTNLTQFVSQGNWKTFYSDGAGDVQELANGTSGFVLTSNGTTSAPSWQAASTIWAGRFNSTFETAGTPVALSTSPVVMNTISGSVTYTLPTIASSSNQSYWVKNAGSGNLTVQRTSTDNIWTTSAVTSEVLAPGESRMYVAATGYWYSYFAGGAAVVPGIDDVLAVGQVMTADRNLDAGTKTLNILGAATGASVVNITKSTGAGSALLGQNAGTGAGLEGRATGGGYGVINRVSNATTNTLSGISQYLLFTSATPAAGIGGYRSWSLPVAASSSIEFARDAVKVTDKTTSSEDADFEFYAMRAGTLTKQLSILSTGWITMGSDSMSTMAYARSVGGGTESDPLSIHLTGTSVLTGNITLDGLTNDKRIFINGTGAGNSGVDIYSEGGFVGITSNVGVYIGQSGVDSAYIFLAGRTKFNGDQFFSSGTVSKDAPQVTLATISSNQTITLPFYGTNGYILVIQNTNTSGFSWLVAGGPVAKPDGTAITAIPNQSLTFYLWDDISGSPTENHWVQITDNTGGTPAGSNTQLQFNNSGAFGASSDLTWDNTELRIGGFKDLNVTGSIFATNAYGRFGWLEMVEAGAFGSVTSGMGVLWVKNDGTLHFKNDANVDIQLGAGGSGGDAYLANTQTFTGVNTFSGGFATTSRQTITSGSSATISNAITTVVFNPASDLGSYTLTMPASPTDGQWIYISFGGTISAGSAVVSTLTLSPNSGQSIYGSLTLTQGYGGDEAAFQYESATTTWKRKK